MTIYIQLCLLVHNYHVFVGVWFSFSIAYRLRIMKKIAQITKLSPFIVGILQSISLV